MNNLRELAIGQPLAAAVAGFVSGGLGLTGKDTMGSDILILIWSVWTILCLLFDAYINRGQGWFSTSNYLRFLMIFCLFGLMIFASLQVTDISTSEFVFYGCLTMSVIVFLFTVGLLIMRIREARKNNEAFPSGIPSSLPDWERGAFTST